MSATLLHAQVVSSYLLSLVGGRRLEGKVHSVFHQAANLLAEGQLLTLAAPQAGALPNGMVMREEADFRSLGLAPGMAIVGNDRSLRIPELDITIDLTEATPWSPWLATKLAPGSVGELASNLKLAQRIAAARAPRSGFGPLLALLSPTSPWSPEPALSPLCQVAHRETVQLLAALDVADAQGAMAAALPLVGLGDGLTPSGDDFLVGLAAGLRAGGHPCAESLAAGCAEAARGRTHVISETYYRHAARGEFSGRIHTLLDALFRGDAAALSGRISDTLSWGSTSGADTLLGVLLGLAAARHAWEGGAE